MESGKINQPQPKSKLPAAIAIGCTSLFWFCCCCLFLNYLFNPLPPTPTPAAQFEPAETIIEATYSAARTQTAIIEFIPPSTATLAPLIETNSTATLHMFEVLTSSAMNTLSPLATQTRSPQPTQPSSKNCNPYYPGVCINDTPRLTCEQLRAKGIYHFRVLPPDPLGYDKDSDGIGCE